MIHLVGLPPFPPGYTSRVENFIEKGLMTSLGAFLFFQEKAGEAMRDAMERGRLEPEEGRRFVEDLNVKFDQDLKEVRARLKTEFEERARDAGVATDRDISDLKARLGKIESRLEDISDAINQKSP